MADKTILVRVSADVGAYQAQMAAAARSTAGFSTSVNSAVAKSGGGLSAMSRVASTFGKLVTIGVAGGLALSAKAAIDFNSSFAGVEKTLSASPAQFAKLRQEIRGLSKEIPLSVNELNRIAELGGQLGVDVEGIEGFTDTIARLGVTTNLSTEQAALGLARFNEILGLSDDQFEAVGSTIVGLGNNFATTEDQILTFALRVAPVGKTVGLTADQVLALATAFSSVGVPAERGGTAVQKTLIKIADAVKSGGQKLEVFAAVAGQSADEFAEAFEQNAGQAFASFIEGLGQIEESGGNVFEVLRSLGLANERTVGSLLAVANGGDILNRTLREGEQAWRDNNALLIESDKRFDTTASKMTIATNKIKDFGIGIGTNLLPIIEEIVGTLGDFFVGLSQLPKAIGITITAILGATVASVALNKVAQKMAFGLGVQVPAGFGKAAFAARAFNAAIGVGLIGAVSLLVTWIAKMGEGKADAARKVDLLVDALKAEEDQLAATTKAAVLAGFTDAERADFEKAGVSANLVANAILDVAGARELLTQKMAEASAAGNEQFLLPYDDDNFGKTAEANTDRLNAANAVLDTLAKGTQAYEDAVASLNREMQETKDARLLEARAQGFNSIREAEYAAGLASGEIQKAFKGLGGEIVDTADDVQEFIDRFEEAVDVMYQETDAAFAFIDATEALAEGLLAAEEAGDDNNAVGIELARLWEDLKRAGADLGAQGIKPVIDRLWEMNQAGLITDAQYVQMLQHLALFEPVAGIVGSSSVNIANAMAFIGGNADLASVDVRNLINMLIGLDAAAYTAFTNLARAIKLPPVVQNLLNAFLPGDVGENINKALNTTSNLITGFLGGYQDIGAAIDKAMAGGVGGSGSSGGGGGGGGSATEKAVEDVLESALDIARDGVRDIENAINAIIDYRAGLKEIADLETEQVTNREEQIQLTRDLAQANKDLARARSEAAKVTLDEQLAIQVAQEALLRAQLAFEQGVITDVELAIAKRNLQDAIDASTNVDDNEAVIDATENIENIQQDINDAKARELEIVEEIYDAQLDMIDAYLDLVAAGEAFNDVGKEALATFRAIAETIGLSTAEIDALLKAAGDAGKAAISFNGEETTTSSKGEFTGSTSGREYIVKAGDTLSAIAAALGITLTQLLKLNPQITNANLIYPGDVIKYHGGGVVQGPRGVEQIAKVLPGEIILNPALGQFPSSNVTIQQLVVQGVFDPTRPQIADQIMTTIERELQNRRVGRVGSRA